MENKEEIRTRLDVLIADDRFGISLVSAIGAIFWDAWEALNGLRPWDRGFHIFWLLGPFILLIERTPSDFWLSIIAISFVFRSVLTRNIAWLKYVWVRLGLIFWLWCIVSAVISANPSYSLGEAAAWYRFPLFAMASVFWLGSDKRFLYAMLVSTAFGLFVMCGILFAELVIVGQQGGRLTWPYGDPLPGSYISKFGLPVFTIMVALAVSASSRLAMASGFFALFTLAVSLMTGERINFLIRACGGMLAGLLWRPKWNRYALLVIVEIAAVVVIFRLMPDMQNRFVNEFYEQLPTKATSPYVKAALPGVEALYASPVLGIGPGNFHSFCMDAATGKQNYRCHPHPHNFYIQLLAETGIVGFVLGSVFFSSIVWSCFTASRKNNADIFDATAWVVPFGLFWPIASTADFFGQWNNIFLWTAVSLALCVTRNKHSDQLYEKKK